MSTLKRMLNSRATKLLMKSHLSKAFHLDADCWVAPGVTAKWTLIWKGGDDVNKGLTEVKR
jgi:hypothetical protein